jgi:fimbrial chaperone protein
MINRIRMGRTLLALGLSLALATPMLAQAADFGVVPLKVLLSPSKATEVLQIHNNADQPLRLQIEGKSWSMDDTGWHLADTDDLIVSPELLTIPAHSEASLRVGSLVPAGEKEAAYRVLLTEIRDSSQAPTNGLSLNVRTQISLPAFIDPPGAAPKITLNSAERKGDDLRIGVGNKDGTARVDAQAATVELLDASGKTLDTINATTGYALGGASMFFEAKATKPGSCGKATQVRVTFTDPVVTLTQPMPAAAQQCSGASS